MCAIGRLGARLRVALAALLFLPLLLPTAVPAADPIRGGLLYDEYWEVSAADPARNPPPEPPSGNHPLYPPAGRQAGEDTYRCNECHGWDYKGADGAYGTGSHFSGIRGVYGSTKSAEEMFDLIKNAAGDTPNGHGFGSLGLTDDDINDLVAFLRTLVIDTDLYIDGSKRFTGDPVQGEHYFNTTGSCSVCHGPDGTRLNFGDETEPDFLGTIAVENPWEVLHKIRVGQPGSAPVMRSWTMNGGGDQGAADIGRYIQEKLPAAAVGRLTIEKGVAKRSRTGSWQLNVSATYDPGDYAADVIEFRLKIDGVPYFDSIAIGPIRKLKRDRRSGKVIKFIVGGTDSNKVAVNLKVRRLKATLKDVPPDLFDPSDGVDVSVQLGSIVAHVSTAVTLRGKNKAILAPATADPPVHHHALTPR